MPRRGGGGGRRAAPKPRARSPPPARKPPAPAPAQQSSGGGMMSGLGGMVAQGMAFGTGSAIAHQAVGAVSGMMGGGGDDEQGAEQQQGGQQQQQQQSQMSGPCADNQQQLYDCLGTNSGNAQACQYYFDALTQCNQTSQQGGFQ